MLRRCFAKAVLGGTPLLLWDRQAQAISAPSFLVFFGYEKVELSPQARKTIAQFASICVKARPNDEVALFANSDTAENSEVLALARGEAVRMCLAELGVSFDRVMIFAYGGTKPLVITGPNVGEPQNRYVELVFSRFSKGQ